jgi:SAM-dependent methyltransferase
VVVLVTTAAEHPGRERPPLPLRLLGQGLSLAIARAPATWRMLRRPTRRFWERAAAGWDERIQPDRPEHLAPLATACEHLDSEPASILELGTGTGAGARMLAHRFPVARIVGVDLSAAMVEQARANTPDELAGRLEFAVGDAASLPYPDGAFDLVAQLNLPAYLAEAARVLAPGGHLIVASSLGASTPYHTPEGLLRKGCIEHHLEPFGAGEAVEAGEGTYFIARRGTEATA